MPVPKPKSLILDRRIDVDLERGWQIGTLAHSDRIGCWQAGAASGPGGDGRSYSYTLSGEPERGFEVGELAVEDSRTSLKMKRSTRSIIQA